MSLASCGGPSNGTHHNAVLAGCTARPTGIAALLKGPMWTRIALVVIVIVIGLVMLLLTNDKLALFGRKKGSGANRAHGDKAKHGSAGRGGGGQSGSSKGGLMGMFHALVGGRAGASATDADTAAADVDADADADAGDHDALLFGRAMGDPAGATHAYRPSRRHSWSSAVHGDGAPFGADGHGAPRAQQPADASTYHAAARRGPAMQPFVRFADAGADTTRSHDGRAAPQRRPFRPADADSGGAAPWHDHATDADGAWGGSGDGDAGYELDHVAFREQQHQRDASAAQHRRRQQKAHPAPRRRLREPPTIRDPSVLQGRPLPPHVETMIAGRPHPNMRFMVQPPASPPAASPPTLGPPRTPPAASPHEHTYDHPYAHAHDPLPSRHPSSGGSGGAGGVAAPYADSPHGQPRTHAPESMDGGSMQRDFASTPAAQSPYASAPHSATSAGARHSAGAVAPIQYPSLGHGSRAPQQHRCTSG